MSLFSSNLPRRLRLPAVIGAVLLGLVACSTADTDTATDNTGATAAAAEPAVYRLGIAAPSATLDPLTAVSPSEQQIASLVAEKLVAITRDGAVEPALATEWRSSADGLTWSVTLREGTEFNDGAPVTADDVVATFESIVAEDSVSPAKSSFAGVLDSVRAVGEREVEFALARPFSDFPRLLAGTNTWILPAGHEPGTWVENPVGAGQFVIEEFSSQSGVTLAKNPRYWNAEDILLDGVELKVYSDDQASLLAFQAGDIDRIAVSADVLATVDEAEYNLSSSGFSHFWAIHFNVTTPPFDDATIREAVAWAIDRDDIVERVFNDSAEAGNDTPFFPDYTPRPEGLEQREQNLERVAELLAGRTVSFTITTLNQLYGEVVQQQLDAIDGFDVELEILSSEQYYAEGDNSPWLNAPVTITSWSKRVPSEYFSYIYETGSSWNASHYANPTLDALAVDYDAATDPAELQRLANEIGRIQWSDVPAVIPAFAQSQTLVNKRVQGDERVQHNYAGISIEDR